MYLSKINRCIKILTFACLTASLIVFPSVISAQKKGGELVARLPIYPRAFNHYIVGSGYSGLIAGFVQESMISQKDENTFENTPLLAKSWQVGEDKLTYTFTIDEEARFSDGKAVTADDIKFTLDTVYSKECVLCQPSRDYVGPMEYVKVLDKYTVEVKMKNIHFQNLERIGGLQIMPKHIYGEAGKDFNKDFNKVLYGSGPYTLQEEQGRKKITLIRNKNWWGHKNNRLPYYKNYYNFDKISFKVVKDGTVAFELFKKKELDFLYMDAQQYAKWDDVESFPWTDKNIGRIDAEKFYPQTWGGIALNMRKAPTNEKKFRKALQLIMNRPLYMKKLFRDKQRPVIGPFAFGSNYSANRKAIGFDLEQASELLGAIGYTEVNDDGVLYKLVEQDGKKIPQLAEFELMYSWKGHDQWASIYKEDAKSIGVKVNLKYLEWTTATKLLDEFKFQTFTIGWSGNPIPGPRQLFHGESVDKAGTSNIPGLNHPEVNRLIEEGPKEFDEKKRYAIYQKMEALIIDEQPYLFRGQDKSHLVGYWKDRLDPTATPFLKFSGSDTRNPFFIRWFAKQ
ncbi:MAG: hypothetical protein HQM13_17870 [SAR324 cluster bacterium]|nr:hypothetical protein [SAR324 cluster bacterium]